VLWGSPRNVLTVKQTIYLEVEMPAKDGDRYILLVGDQPFSVETVVTPQALARGLSGRPFLPRGHGMLFQFETLARQGMWMIEMKFPLDIVWLDEQLTVIHITRGAPPCASRANCPTYSSVKRAKYAIEMNSGDADTYRFREGMKLRVISG
jgi:uncharacterized membrane protein (UPF0127 family)